jgi:hypothetical protein
MYGGCCQAIIKGDEMAFLEIHYAAGSAHRCHP